MNNRSAASPSASAGTSSMKLKSTNTAGEKAITINPVRSHPGAKRATDHAVDRHKINANGKSQNLSSKRCSPKIAIPKPSQ